MLIKIQHYKDYGVYTESLDVTCVKEGGLNEVANKYAVWVINVFILSLIINADLS